ncbi:hypothetical protein CROQUDRAFT_94103 [Cronartium quercuum f. sp. fusiforme G11]|uniref:Uncharacterized protein n=1 Tax=Cronartium quercuum f. sp. fusiforme G11 TaxID=708437 RepID=A0A9P6NJF0_9BASI|nr:hypothetical protein CROQUDRAFT_94103 [Cronartium quercuum f. sp. fusiforme G11]
MKPAQLGKRATMLPPSTSTIASIFPQLLHPAPLQSATILISSDLTSSTCADLNPAGVTPQAYMLIGILLKTARHP